MKYSKSEIMKKAWSLYRDEYGTFPVCLKRAWEIYKMPRGMRSAVLHYDHYFTNHAYASMEMQCNRWTKYGKDRTYINAIARNAYGIIVKTYKVGYIDNIDGEFVAA